MKKLTKLIRWLPVAVFALGIVALFFSVIVGITFIIGAVALAVALALLDC